MDQLSSGEVLCKFELGNGQDALPALCPRRSRSLAYLSCSVPYTVSCPALACSFTNVKRIQLDAVQGTYYCKVFMQTIYKYAHLETQYRWRTTVSLAYFHYLTCTRASVFMLSRMVVWKLRVAEWIC